MEVQYDTSETSLRKFAFLGTVQCILGCVTIGMSIAYLPGAAAAGLLQGGGRLSLVFVLSSLLYGVFLTSQIILSFRMREKAANVSRNGCLYLGANIFNCIASIAIIILTTILIKELTTGGVSKETLQYPAVCMIAAAIETFVSLTTAVTLLFRFPPRQDHLFEYYSDFIMF